MEKRHSVAALSSLLAEIINLIRNKTIPCFSVHISAPDSGAPPGRDRGEERAGDSQLQGDGGPGAQRGVAEGRRAGDDCQGRPQVPQVRPL